MVNGPFKQPVEAAPTSKADQPLAGKNWEFLDDRLWNRNYDNYQDLSGYYAVKKGVDTHNQTLYTSAWIYAPSELTAELRYGVSGTHRLFLDGTEIHKATTPKQVQREMFKLPVTLKQGWHHVLFEIHHSFTDDTNANGAFIAKDDATSYLGIYARLCDAQGNAIPGAFYSVAGPNSKSLTIDTQPLAAQDVVADPKVKSRGLPTNVLPTGYREWPYVWNKTLTNKVDNRRIWADHYRFSASGGTPGYAFQIIDGSLPDGVTLNPDGSLDGVCTKIGTFAFTLEVKDSKGATATKELSITVKERPNRWFELGRVGALSHCISVYPFWVDPHFSADLWAERARRQGHSLVSIESLQQNYYWPSKFEDPKHPRNQFQPRDKAGKVLDGLKPFADAVKRHGMKFGIYYATEGGGLAHHSTDVFVQNCSELINRYDPAYLYFDGPQAMGWANYDVMYSNVRNHSEDIIINSNVWSHHGEFGDADLGTSESSHIYAAPHAAVYNKRTIVEPWKSAHTKNNPTPYYAKRDDFRQVAKEMVMNAGRGLVDNNDQMPLMSRGPNWDSPADIAQRYPKAVQEFSDLREGLANWFAQPGKPELHESTTGTMPYFLEGCGYEDDGMGNLAAFGSGKGPAWGYATSRDNAIYLHFIQGPDGKQGYTGQESITISPVKHKVLDVSYLNQAQPLKFKQEGEKLTISLKGITADPVDTIVKIVTNDPTRNFKLTNITLTEDDNKGTSLTLKADGYATFPALKVPFAKGEVSYSSSNPAVAKVDDQGTVTAIAAAKATITVEGTHEGAKASSSIAVLVDDRKMIRIDDELVDVVLKVTGKEAYVSSNGSNRLIYTIEGRTRQGGSADLSFFGEVTLKSGIVNYAKGTQYQPVFIEEKPIFTSQKEYLIPAAVESATRAAVWAEVKLDGKSYTTNKVFIDLDPAESVAISKAVSSGHLGKFSPERSLDGIGISRDASDSSKWSADGKNPSWIAFDLKQASKVSEVEILFNTRDQAYINTPATMEIQASNDAKTWQTLATFTPPSHGSGAHFGFTNTFRFKPSKTRYLRLSFPKGNPKGDSVDLLEVKLKASTINNLALVARISASSIANDNYRAENVIDGILAEHGKGEWASKAEPNPWVRLVWQSKTAINKIVLRDRPNPHDHLRQGSLTFSDGSVIEVKDIPNDGSPKVIDFPTKSVEWIKFQATNNATGNNGLSEVEVYGPKNN